MIHEIKEPGTISPLAGQPAPKEMLIDVARLEREYYERKPDLGDPDQLVSFGTSGHRGTPLRRHVHRGAHPGHHPGHLRLPPRPGHRRPALHGQGHARALRARPSARRSRCWRPTASRPSSSATTASRRRRSSRDAILVYNRGRTRAPRRRHRHHAVAQSAGGRRLQVQPAQRRPGRHRRHGVDPGPRQRAAARAATPASSACRSRRRSRRPRRTRRTSSCPTSTTCGTSSTWTPSAAPASSWASTRSAARPCPTGSRSTDVYGLDIAVVNPTIDPTFSFMTVDHDGKIRMDCSSPYAMARPGRAQGPVPRRLRQRPRLRPARHRHAAPRG